MAGSTSSAQLEQVERWFTRRGVPHFIAHYDARTDIWIRAVPLLVPAYLLGGLNALQLRDWSVVENLAAAAMVVVVLVITWAVTNRLRHRPLLTLPVEIGPPELAVFVLGPTLPSFVLGQWGDGIQAALEGAGVLLVIYLVTSYGVLPLLGWAASQSASQVVLFLNTLVRVLPLLLLFITFLFINAEVWQVAGTLTGWPYWAVLAIFFLLGVVFVLSRVPALLASLATFDDWGEVRALVTDTPADALCELPAEGDPEEYALSRRERLNIALVSILSQSIQVTLVVLAVFAFFNLFGFLAISKGTTEAWTTLPNIDPLVGQRLVITEPLVRVAGFLAAFTGMYFTVVLSTDSAYREEFAEDVAPRIRQALAVRTAYRYALHDTSREIGAE
ncbi:MAG: hypothetical protein AB7Q42_10860 [Acidimicrobiia bacterium]